MNKAMLFPMVFMFILTMFSVIWGETGYYAPIHGESGNVTIGQGGTDFDMWTATGILVVLIGAVALGTIAGIHFLGSGLSDTSQHMIFASILFLGLWACLTVVSRNYLFESSVTMILWVCLTVMYVVGVGITINGSSE